MAFSRSVAVTVTHTKTLISPSTGSADKVYGADYVASNSHSGSGTESISGADVGGIPYCPTATTEATSPNFVFDGTKFLTVGTTSGTSAGLILGYSNSSGYGGIFAAAVGNGGTPSFYTNGVNTYIYGSTANITQAPQFIIQPGGDTKFTQLSTAGIGPSITAGTATTDVAALSITRTNSNAAVAKGVEILYTDTTSAAGFTPLWIKGGAAAATSLLKLSKAGLLDCPSYAVGGAAGVSFGPAAVASITVVNGIITAIS